MTAKHLLQSLGNPLPTGTTARMSARSGHASLNKRTALGPKEEALVPPALCAGLFDLSDLLLTVFQSLPLVTAASVPLLQQQMPPAFHSLCSSCPVAALFFFIFRI